KNTTQTQHCTPPLITEKRRRPRPKGGNNIAFNYECCNYTPSSLSVFSLEVLSTRS
ncbi:replication protein, partial [Escherichia coli]